MINANEVTWDDQVPDDNGITWDEPSQNASLSPNEITWDENPDAGLGVVGRTAKAGRQFAQSIGKGAGNAMLGLATQIENAPLMPAPYQTPGMLRDIRSTESGRQYYEDVKAGKLIGKNPISEGLRTGSEAYQVEEGRPLGFFSDVTKGIAEFIPSMALSAVNPVMGTAATFEQLTGSKYEQYINEGKDEKTAFDAATLSALLNTPVEQAGNLLQIGKIAKLLDTKALSGVGTGFKKYLKTIFENALTEGGEELVQQQFDIIADQYANNPDADPVELGKNVWNQFASMKNVGESGKAFAGGFAGGLLMTGAASGAGVAQEIINEKGWIGADNKPIDILEPPTLPKKYELNAEQIDTLKKGYESGDITDDNLNAIILDKNTPPDIVKAINQMRVQKQSQNQPIDILKPKETVQGFDTSWPVNKSAEESAGVFTRQETQDEEGQRIMSNLNPENMERLKIQYAQKDPYLVDIAMRMFNGEQFDLKDMDKQDLRSLTILVGEDVINSQNGEMPIPTREGRGLITTGLQTTPQEPVIEQQRALPPPPADIGPEGEGQFAPPRRGPVAQGTGPVIPMGQLAKGDNPKNYSGDELRQIAKDNNLEIPKNMLKKTDMINFIKQGVQGNDQGIRENERQLPEGRIEQEGGAGESGENLELETSGEPGGTKEEIDQAAHEAATSPLNDIPEPTEAQKEAGNYKKGHVNLQGLDISIENPKGSTRSGVSKQGKKWSIEMQHHYGYIKSTEGKDHDQVDVFIGGNPESDKVFIVNQINPTNQKFDEHKVLIGFKDEESAKQAYLSNYEKGWKGMGSIAPMSMDEFKTWVKEGDQKKPVNVPRVTKETPIKVQRSSDEAGENTLYEVIEGPQKGSSISRGAITQAPEKYAIDESLMPSVAKKAEVDVNEAMAKELEKAKAKKTQQVTSIPKNKYDVYSTDVNGKTMYSYRDNMENDKGFGDPLFDTEEKAKTEAEIYKNVEAKNAESRRKVLEVEAGKSAKLDAEKAQREDLNGFGKDLDRMRKGKVVKTLNGKRNFDGKIMTIKEKIKELVDNNAEIFTREEDVIQPMSRRQYNNATQQEQDAHERRMKEAGKKTVYYVGGYNLGKTAYDYANHLKSLTSPKPEAKAVNPTELTESGVKTKEQVHDYSNTQVPIFGKVAKEIVNFGNRIPDTEIYTNPEAGYESGRENEPHITVRYGLATDDVTDLKKAFKDTPPIKAKLGKVSIFEADDHDVVKVDIDSPELRKANKIVGDTVDLPGETFKDYKPHATIAYVKKGEGKKYVGDLSFEGKEVTFDKIQLSTRTGKLIDIPLNATTPAPDTVVEGKGERKNVQVNEQALSDLINKKSEAKTIEKPAGEKKYSIKDIKPLTINSIPKAILSKMNRTLKAKGYDVRGADDIKALMKRNHVFQDGKFTHPDWQEAYDKAIGSETKRKETIQSKNDYKNIDWKRIRELGTTADIREAGYIKPDGSLVDLSGKKEGGPPGSRSYDHREAGGTAGMQELMDFGYIRMDYAAGTIDMLKPPTSQQKTVIRKIIENHNGEIYLDLADGLGTQSSSGYYSNPDRTFNNNYDKGTRSEKILNDIDTFFEGNMPYVRAFSITHKQKQALKSVTKADIHKAFPGSRVIPYKIEVDGQEHDGFLVTLSSGQNVAISPSQDFISIPNIEEVAKEYGISPSELKKKLSTGDKRIRGAFTPDVAESTSLIELLSTSDPGDLSHEKFHFLFGLLNKSDRGKIFTRYKTEEKAAEAFRKREGFTKTFWEKIQRILERIKDFIFGDSFKPVFEQLQGQVETGGKKFNIEDNISEIDDDKYLELAKDPEKNREELQKMVNNAAIRAGYDPSIEYRMQHQAPDSVSGIRLDKAMEDETVPKDYWERPDYYQYSGDEYSSFYKIKKAIELQKQYDSEGEGKKSRIWVYRAVPKNIKDENFRNGDWITPSREYARSEGKQIPEGYKVIAKKVDITDIYWDVNSINELGYDDGKNYAYKNTKNNRKLLDPVIYSPSGAFIIPLSKRFNFREYSTKYSIEDVKTKQKSVSQLNTYDEIMDYLTNKNASTPEIRKESKLAKRTEADTIEAKLAEEFGDLVEYKTRPEFMKDQAAKAEDLLNSNYEKAKKIAMGEIDPPGDLRIATVYEAVKLRALNDNDIDLLYDLGTASKVPTRLSEYGQAIKAADSSIIEDPVKAMQDIEKDRKNKLKKKGKKVVSIEEVRKLKAKLAEAEKKLSEYESKTDDKKSEAEIDRLIDSSPRKSYKKINQSDITSKIKTAIDSNQELSDISTDIQELAKYFITQGMVTRGALVKAVYDVLKAGPMPDITLRETMDAISGYGKWKPLSKDAVLIKLRDLKGQMQQVAKLEDMQRGMAPLKTGIERRTPTDEERRLIKQVEEMKKELGIEVIDPEKQLKSALDSVKTRLSNQIRDLEYQIESGEKIVKKKTGLKYDVEAEKLKKRRDELKQEFDNLFGKPKISDEQRIQMAIKAVERSIIEYTRKINENDLTPLAKRNPLQSKELEALRAERDELKAKVKELRDLAKPKRSPEEISLQRLKTRLKNETEKLTEKLKGLELVKTERKETVYDAEARKLKEVRDNIKQAFNSAVEARGAVTKEEADRLIELSRAMAAARKEMEEGGDRFKYGAAKVAFLRYIDYLKGSDASIKTLLKDEWAEVKAAWKDNKASAFTKSGKDIIQTISDLSISLMASLDNSFMGRQGLNTLLTHPTVWAPAAKKSFVDIYQTIISKHGGNMVRDAAMADAYSRPNYVSGDYDTAKLIPKTEEQFPTSIPGRIPLIGRAFNASENAFLNSGVRMRINTYDLLKRIAEAQDVKIDKEWIQETGKLINSITARGDLGKMGQGGPLRLIFWAPKMLWGNINVLTAHFGGAGLKTPFARQQVRINLAKIIGFTVLAAAIADGLGEMFGKKDTVEWNPISSDFMKIKVGNTRFDLTAGKGSIITLMARAATFKTKSTRTKKVGKLNSGRYGSKTLFDVMIDFMANKSAPVTKTAIDIARGRNFNYEKPGIGNTAYNLVTPIGVQNFIETYQRDNKDIPTEEIIGNVLDMVGINASTYDSNAEQRKKYRELRKAD